MSSLKFFLKKYKIDLSCFFIFVSIIFLLGLPFIKWGFFLDAFADIFHVKDIGWNGALQFFTEGDAERFHFPSNVKRSSGFFCGVYRPLSFTYFLIQHTFFGTNAYYYFFVLVVFHALATILFFRLFLYVTTYVNALIGALFFGFHPSLWCWFGWISAQSYHIECLILLSIILFFYLYLKEKRIIYFWISCLLFFHNLFLKEQSIFFPVWLLFALPFYNKIFSGSYFPKGSFLKNLFLSIPFFFSSIIYLGIRLFAMPFSSDTQTLGFSFTWQSFLERQMGRFYDLVSYITDIFGICWLPLQHQFIKASLILLLAVFFLWLFYYNTKKPYILFCIMSIFMFGWPSIVRFHHPRYIYSAIPFFVLMVILLLQFYKGPSLNKKVIYFIFLCFLSLNIIFVVYSVKKMEHEGNLITTVFQQLANDDVVYDKTICFVDLPHCWFRSASAQAVWMYQKKQLRKPIYQYQNFNNIDKSVLNDPNVVFVKWDMTQSKFVVFDK